ncbi:hypothetical protein CLV96_0291 [Leptospira meyeri]|uniref:Uncharacterized protein n=1 Tax=Leptospira meyeri TaxID=29508 RepID=A0A4R8MPQ5_LEPME|nr:hypothetical protein [Leptospira meyeri]EKJ85345.1 hypothetical protein LEP1GSC017_3679 [Leptospira meyeri serovar Hardjo str. Went 5]TDY71329.1 hypothetical protein CLV96_0291 [Leptospira meyeri]
MPKQKEDLGTEDSSQEEAKISFFRVFTSRLEHPYLGTYFISFVIFNFNSILKLIVGLNDKYTDYELTIDTFTKNFDIYNNFKENSHTVFIPLIPTILFPSLLNYLGETILAFSSTWFGSLMDNIKQRNDRKEYKARIKSLNLHIFGKNVEIQNLTAELDALGERLLEAYEERLGFKGLRIIKSSIKFKRNDLVSQTFESDALTTYNRNNHFVGVNIDVLGSNMFVVRKPSQEILHDIISE